MAPGRAYVVLHKREWERIKQQANTAEKSLNNYRDEYFKYLTEKSQEWTKTWPDSVAGYIAKAEIRKKKERENKIALIEEYRNKHQDNNAGTIIKAKQTIFTNSCYGRKLLSAIVESKVLEEREAQISFKKSLEERSKQIEDQKNQAHAKEIIKMHDKDAKLEREMKLCNLECQKINREIESQKKQMEIQKKEIETRYKIDEEIYMKKLIDNEVKQQKELKRLEEQALIKYEEERKKLKMQRERREKHEAALIKACKQQQDKVELKIKSVTKKIISDQQNLNKSSGVYEMIEKSQNAEKKRYDNFIDVGVNKYEGRICRKEIEDEAKQKEKQSMEHLISIINENTAAKDRNASCLNKYVCDRQSLILKQKKLTRTECNEPHEGINGKEKLQFLKPQHTLLEQLRKREKVPSPWNGTKGEHQYFVQQAETALRDCKYKQFARKVVDEYRKSNGLNAKELPISNY